MVKINKNFLLLSACAIALGLSIKNFSHGNNRVEYAKIAIADYGALMQALPEFETTQKEFQSYVVAQQEIQNKKIESLKQREEDYKKVEAELSEEEKKIRQENLFKEERKLQEEAVKFRGELQEKNDEGMRFLKEKLEKNFIDNYAKNNKIDMIFDSEACQKVYNKKFDVTNDIMDLIKKSNSKAASSIAKK